MDLVTKMLRPLMGQPGEGSDVARGLFVALMVAGVLSFLLILLVLAS